MMRRAMCMVLFVCGLLTQPACSAAAGRYEGDLVAKDSGDGRVMILVEPYAFIDGAGLRWDARIGMKWDGASIPRVAWTIIGGPFEGLHRNASVIHDQACFDKDRPWQAVHRMFFEAMLVSGVDEAKAKIMYAAVYHFGPRWTVPLSQTRVPNDTVTLFKRAAATGIKPSFDERLSVKSARVMADTAEGRRDDQPMTRSNSTDVFVMLVPNDKTMSNADFERLKAAIESQPMTLAEIEQFK